MRLSYAQNLEDVHLAQVFAGEPPGLYVDVGAGHPVADNVTFHLYLSGWRGLVVEPQARWAGLYAGVRPRDVAVCALAGAAPGEAELFEVERLHGLSTTVLEHARGAASFGAGYRTRRLPVETVAGLCRTHGLEAVDLLKIDVEGAEAAVLEGAELASLRPRLVLVEAVVPGSMAPAHAAFEPLLLAAGYACAWFDGLNRWYLRPEEAALRARLPREKADWGAVEHAWDHGPAAASPRHPDHALARALLEAFLTALPRLGTELLVELLSAGREPLAVPDAAERAALRELLVGQAEFPGRDPPLPEAATRAALLEALLASDRVRAALGRIAAHYDGGHLPE
jgi:FkbM family methyltransferase